MRTAATPVLHHPLGRPVDSLARLTKGWLPDGLPGRLSDSQIAGKHPSVIDRRSYRATAGTIRRGTCRAYYRL